MRLQASKRFFSSKKRNLKVIQQALIIKDDHVQSVLKQLLKVSFHWKLLREPYRVDEFVFLLHQ
jgi:hypothetical protein